MARAQVAPAHGRIEEPICEEHNASQHRERKECVLHRPPVARVLDHRDGGTAGARGGPGQKDRRDGYGCLSNQEIEQIEHAAEALVPSCEVHGDVVLRPRALQQLEGLHRVFAW